MWTCAWLHKELLAPSKVIQRVTTHLILPLCPDNYHPAYSWWFSYIINSSGSKDREWSTGFEIKDTTTFQLCRSALRWMVLSLVTSEVRGERNCKTITFISNAPCAIFWKRLCFQDIKNCTERSQEDHLGTTWGHHLGHVWGIILEHYLGHVWGII